MEVVFDFAWSSSPPMTPPPTPPPRMHVVATCYEPIRFSKPVRLRRTTGTQLGLRGLPSPRLINGAGGIPHRFISPRGEGTDPQPKGKSGGEQASYDVCKFRILTGPSPSTSRCRLPSPVNENFPRLVPLERGRSLVRRKKFDAELGPMDRPGPTISPHKNIGFGEKYSSHSPSTQQYGCSDVRSSSSPAETTRSIGSLGRGKRDKKTSTIRGGTMATQQNVDKPENRNRIRSVEGGERGDTSNAASQTMHS